MDKSLRNRLEILERRVLDIGDVRSATTQQLEDYLTELLCHPPSTADLERLVAEAQAAEEPKA